MSLLSKVIYKIGILLYNTFINKIPSRTIRKIFCLCLGAKINKSSILFRNTELINACGLKIGRKSSVGWFSLLDARGGISIGDNVTVASYSKLITGSHDIDDPLFHAKFKPIVIEDYAWICTGAIILQGVTIGRGAVVCAGAVVNKDVPPMSVVGGVPARIIKERKTEPLFQDDMKWSWLH